MPTARQDMVVVVRGEVADIKAKLNATTRDIKQLKTAAQQVGRAGAKAGKQAGAGMAAVGKGAKASAAGVKTLQASINGMAASMKLFIAVAAAGLISRALVGTIVDFQDAIAQVEIVLRPTREELVRLGEAAKLMGETTLFSATEAANGLKLLGQAGFDTAQAIAVLPKTLDLAVGAQLSLEAATEQTAGVLRAFGLDVSQVGEVTDALILGQSKAANTVTEFAEGIAKVGPVAKLAKISLQETTAALGLLANNMIKGSDGGTALRNVIIRLAAPAADGARAIKNLGLRLEQVNPEAVGLQQALLNLKNAGFSGVGQAADIFGKKMAAGGAILVGVSEDMDELTAAVTGMGEATEAAAERMEQTISSKFELIKSQFRGVILGKEDGIAGLVLGLEDATLVAIPAFAAAITGIQSALEATLGTITGFLEGLSKIAALIPGLQKLDFVSDTLEALTDNLFDSSVASSEAARGYGEAAGEALGLGDAHDKLGTKIERTIIPLKELQAKAKAALEGTEEQANKTGDALADLGANTSLAGMRQSLGIVDEQLDEAAESATALGSNLDTAGTSTTKLQTKTEAVQKIMALLEENTKGSKAQIEQFGRQLSNAIGPARDLEGPVDVVQESLKEVAKAAGVTEEEFSAIKALLELAVPPSSRLQENIDATAQVAADLRDKGFGEEQIKAMIQPTTAVRDALGPAQEAASRLSISMTDASASTNSTATAAGILRQGIAGANEAALDLEATVDRLRAKFGGGGGAEAAGAT